MRVCVCEAGGMPRLAVPRPPHLVTPFPLTRPRDVSSITGSARILMPPRRARKRGKVWVASLGRWAACTAPPLERVGYIGPAASVVPVERRRPATNRSCVPAVASPPMAHGRQKVPGGGGEGVGWVGERLWWVGCPERRGWSRSRPWAGRAHDLLNRPPRFRCLCPRCTYPPLPLHNEQGSVASTSTGTSATRN